MDEISVDVFVLTYKSESTHLPCKGDPSDVQGTRLERARTRSRSPPDAAAKRMANEKIARWIRVTSEFAILCTNVYTRTRAYTQTRVYYTHTHQPYKHAHVVAFTSVTSRIRDLRIVAGFKAALMYFARIVYWVARTTSESRDHRGSSRNENETPR